MGLLTQYERLKTRLDLNDLQAGEFLVKVGFNPELKSFLENEVQQAYDAEPNKEKFTPFFKALGDRFKQDSSLLGKLNDDLKARPELRAELIRTVQNNPEGLQSALQNYNQTGQLEGIIRSVPVIVPTAAPAPTPPSSTDGAPPPPQAETPPTPPPTAGTEGTTSPSLPAGPPRVPVAPPPPPPPGPPLQPGESLQYSPEMVTSVFGALVREYKEKIERDDARPFEQRDPNLTTWRNVHPEMEAFSLRLKSDPALAAAVADNLNSRNSAAGGRFQSVLDKMLSGEPLTDAERSALMQLLASRDANELNNKIKMAQGFAQIQQMFGGTMGGIDLAGLAGFMDPNTIGKLLKGLFPEGFSENLAHNGLDLNGILGPIAGIIPGFRDSGSFASIGNTGLLSVLATGQLAHYNTNVYHAGIGTGIVDMQSGGNQRNGINDGQERYWGGPKSGELLYRDEAGRVVVQAKDAQGQPIQDKWVVEGMDGKPTTTPAQGKVGNKYIAAEDDRVKITYTNDKGERVEAGSFFVGQVANIRGGYVIQQFDPTTGKPKQMVQMDWDEMKNVKLTAIDANGKTIDVTDLYLGNRPASQQQQAAAEAADPTRRRPTVPDPGPDGPTGPGTGGLY
jgi:hypothetical protein